MQDIEFGARLNFKLLSLFVFLILLSAKRVSGQNKAYGIDTGKTVPEINLTNFLDDAKKKVPLSNFKDRLVILDFWGVYCSACLEGMPKMDSLQKKYGDKIKIILVTKDRKEQVSKLFDRIKMWKSIADLDVITDDLELSKMFPHQSEPHHVWIDHGVYRYGTYFYNATGENIQRIIEHDKVDFTQKQEDSTFNEDKSLISQIGSKFKNNLEEYSLFLKGMNRFFAGSLVQFLNDSISARPVAFHAINQSPVNLLQSAFNFDIYGVEGMGVYNLKHNYRMVVEVKSPEFLYEPKSYGDRDKWYKDNAISYEVKVTNPTQLYTKMQDDLNGYLPYQGRIESRRTICYVLKRKVNTGVVKTKGGEPSIKFRGQIEFINQPMKRIVKEIILHQGDNSLPLIDQTGYQGNLDITLRPKVMADMDLLNKELNQLGFAIEKKKIKIPMLVIRDKTKGL